VPFVAARNAQLASKDHKGGVNSNAQFDWRNSKGNMWAKG
jgi:hypothetical protein